MASERLRIGERTRDGGPRRGATLAGTIALAIALAASASHAEPTPADKATARSLMDRGDALVAAKDLAAALAAYRGAHEIMRVPTTGIEVAKAHEALGQLVEALDAALEVTRMPTRPDEPEAFAKARATAAELARRVEPRVPTLTITVRGAADDAPPKVELDGAALPAAAAGLPRKVNAGRHVVKVTAEGRVPVTREVLTLEGHPATADVTLVPSATQPVAAPTAAPATAQPPPQATPPRGEGVSPLVILGFGAGAIGLGVGAVTGAMSLSRASDAKKLCDDTRCRPEAGPDIDAAKGLAWGSNIGFAIGVVGVGVGVVGLLLGPSPPKPAKAAVTPTIGPGWAGVGGAF